jgi:hypothetical protein
VTANYDKEADDRIHDLIAGRLARENALRGGVQAPPETTLFRLSWLCKNCSDVHMMRGNAAQVQNSATAFILWDYPMVMIHAEAFCVLAETEGKDLGNTEHLKELADEYTQFLARTRT